MRTNAPSVIRLSWVGAFCFACLLSCWLFHGGSSAGEAPQAASAPGPNPAECKTSTVSSEEDVQVLSPEKRADISSTEGGTGPRITMPAPPAEIQKSPSGGQTSTT